MWTCVLFALLPVVHGADEGVRAVAPEKLSTSHFRPVSPGGTLRVVNPFGDVHARFGGYGNEAEILATSQRLESSRPELEMRFSTDGQRTDVVVADPGAADKEIGSRDRIDLVVFVPLGIALAVRTSDGTIAIKGLRGDVDASSVSGNIRLGSVKGRVRAKSSRGDILAELETGVTTEPQELVTETGEIEAWLWEDAQLRVEIRTSGQIRTDFSLDIEHQRFEEPSKHAVAVAGDGGAELLLRSKQGDVGLLRLVRHFQREP